MSETPREDPERAPVREDDEARGEGLGRILALSDGVFAIALTILVIEIALPSHVADEHLRGALARLGPKYVAYVLSFLVIGRFWLAHHLAFRYIDRSDGRLLWLNLILLMMVAFLPFPTSVLGNYGNVPEAALLYGGAAVLTSGASAALWWYASSGGRLLRPGTPPRLIRVPGRGASRGRSSSRARCRSRRSPRTSRRGCGCSASPSCESSWSAWPGRSMPSESPVHRSSPRTRRPSSTHSSPTRSASSSHFSAVGILRS
jgi:uncharacterized membrane protein